MIGRSAKKRTGVVFSRTVLRKFLFVIGSAFTVMEYETRDERERT